MLSSRRVPANLAAHTRGRRATLITNAAEYYDRAGRGGRADKVIRDTAGLERAGFTVTPMDLRHHDQRRPAALLAALTDTDVVCKRTDISVRRFASSIWSVPRPSSVPA